MSKPVVISPGESLTEEVIRHFEPDGFDYSRTVVVFPGKRPAHFLRKRLGEQLGRSCIPPRIFSIDAFIDYAYSELLGEVRHSLEPLDAVVILHSLHLESADRPGGRSFDTLDAFVPLGLKMFGELEELKLADVPERSAQLGLTPLARLYGSFYLKVVESGYTTRSLKYWAVARNIETVEWKKFRTIILAGFFALTNAEKALFSRLMGLDHVHLIFQKGRGIDEHLRELGADNPEGSDEKEGRLPGPKEGCVAHYYRSPDLHGQVFGLAAYLKEFLDSGGSMDERTVVVLPSPDTLFPAVHHALSLIPGSNYNISLGYPLSRTPIFGFLQSAMNAVTSMHDDKFYAPEYIKFVLHPYTKNIRLRQRTDVTRILFHAVEEYLAGDKSRTLFSLDELEGENALFDEVVRRVEAIDAGLTAGQIREHLGLIHERTLRKLLSVRSVADLANTCNEIVAFVEEESTARVHPMFGTYLRSMREALDGIMASKLAENTFAELTGYFTFVQQCLRQAEVAFPGTPLGGMQVLGLLETRNLQFDKVIVLDANDDVLPGSGLSQTLVPLKVREALGLPTHRDREAIVAYYIDLLLKGAKEAHFFYLENDRKVKSRFLEELLWEKQKEDKEGDVDTFISSIRFNVALGGDIPSPIDKNETVIKYLRNFRYTATALDTYLQCQLKFYYGHVLKLREKEEVTGEIESAEVGRFVHKVLAALFSPAIGKKLQRDMLGPETIDKVVDAIFGEVFGIGSHGGKQWLNYQVRRQLSNFVGKYQIPLLARQQVEVLGVEQEIEVRWGGYALRGRLDRVEKRGEKVYVLDYKTKNNDGTLAVRLDRLKPEERTTWRDAIGSLQLPVYALLYSTRFGKPLDEVVPAYLFLGNNQLDETIEVELAREGIPSGEYYRQTGDVLSKLLAEVTDIHHPFMPTDDLKSNCPFCDFRAMCGTQWVRRTGW